MSVFQRAVRTLTLKYLVIIMALSLLFSFALYQVTSREYNERLRGQLTSIVKHGGFITTRREDLEELRLKELDEARQRLKVILVIFNILTLTGGLAISYVLAKETLEPIEEAMNSLNRFTADASHELRTPLTAMRAEIEVALRAKKLTTQEAKELLNSNLEEIERLESLSSGLLLLARGREKADSSNFQPVELNKVVKSAVSSLSPLAKTKELKIICRLEDNVIVQGDASSLSQLCVILLDNAIKYSPTSKEITINLTTHKQVILEVKDQGIGISKQDQKHIFDRFYRADQSRTTPGNGLGLAIAKQIVEQHNGSVTARSTLGSGSTFIVTLPL